MSEHTTTPRHHLLTLATAGRVEEFEAAWLETLEDPPPAAHYLESLAALPAEHRGGAAAPLLALVLEACQRQQRHADVLVVVRALLPHRTSGVDLERSAREALAGLHGEEEWFELFARLSGLSGRDPLEQTLQRFESLCGLLPGRVVFHRSGWGEGLVRAIDVPQSSFSVVFRQDEVLRSMPFSTGLEVLEPLDPRDLRARLLVDVEGLRTEAEERPSHLVRSVARLHRGRATVKEIKHWLQGPVVETRSWTGWWKKAKAAAVNDPWLAVDNPARPVFVLRSKALSAGDEVRAAMGRAGDLSALLEVVSGPLSLEPQEEVKRAMLERVEQAVAAGGRPAARVEAALLLARHGAWTTERAAAVLAELLEGGTSFVQLVDALSGNPARRAAFDLLVAARPRLWSDDLIGDLAALPLPLLDAVAERLVAEGRGAALANRFRIFLLSPSRQPAVVLRLAKRYAEGLLDDAPDAPTLPEVVLGVLHLAETQAPRAARGDKAAKEIVRQLAELITARKRNALLPRFAAEGTRVDLEQAVSVLRRCRSIPDEIEIAVTKAVHERFPDLVPRDEVPFWETNAIFCSRDGIARRHEEYRVLLEEKIPENSETIGRAASYGDLSENFEWTAAIEQQRQLTERAAAMEAELKLAQPIEDEEVTGEIVAPGTRVTFVQDGERKTLAILGPWDIGEGIVSYRAPVAAGMLGAKVGEQAQLDLPQGASTVTIEAIEKIV